MGRYNSEMGAAYGSYTVGNQDYGGVSVYGQASKVHYTS